MREILFRGKRIDNGRWIYGDLRHWRNGAVGIHDEIIGRTIPVMPKTVGQDTGLIDENGKRIFEGDILFCIARLDAAKMVVIFEQGEFRMVVAERYKDYTTGLGYYHINCFTKEIVGNIHDNPELLNPCERGGDIDD